MTPDENTAASSHLGDVDGLLCHGAWGHSDLDVRREVGRPGVAPLGQRHLGDDVSLRILLRISSWPQRIHRSGRSSASIHGLERQAPRHRTRQRGRHHRRDRIDSGRHGVFSPGAIVGPPPEPKSKWAGRAKAESSEIEGSWRFQASSYSVQVLSIAPSERLCFGDGEDRAALPRDASDLQVSRAWHQGLLNHAHRRGCNCGVSATKRTFAQSGLAGFNNTLNPGAMLLGTRKASRPPSYHEAAADAMDSGGARSCQPAASPVTSPTSESGRSAASKR